MSKQNYYCRVSYSIDYGGVMKVGVTVQAEQFARPNDMCITIKTYRPERAAMMALERYLLLDPPIRTVLDPAKPPDSFTKKQVQAAIKGY